jgi:dihydrofolate synthase / folylpolyglutamate synthase
MNYKEALSYIYSFTDYERGSKYSRKRDENIQREAALLELLGNPHGQYSNTLIAGTKGKGSTSAYIERVLREAGIRTGLYIQPDLHTFRERIRVNGGLIGEQEVAQLIPEIRAAVEQIQDREIFEPFITYEIGTALALLYFARQHVRHAVVEVGLGGRLDATNVTRPLVSVITSISYDHMEILGDTLAKIATEKAGIIKPHGIVVTSAQSPEALLAIADIAEQRQARMIRIGPEGIDPAQTDIDEGHLPAMSYRYQLGTGERYWRGEQGRRKAPDRRKAQSLRRQELQSFTVRTPTGSYRDLETPLLGTHQVENATLAIAALEVLREAGYDWDEVALRNGLRSVHWPARIQVVGQHPTIVVDGAHNTDSMQKLLQSLDTYFSFHRLTIVLGVLKNKDQVGMVRALANVDTVILTRVSNPRATPPEELVALFAEHAPHVSIHQVERSDDALDLACDLADREDLICATGSLYLAGEALRNVARRGNAAVAAEIEGVDHP